MLKITVSTTLSANSEVESGGHAVAAVTMQASITDGRVSNVYTNIINQEAYDANKKVCRADIDAFTQFVREKEDEEEDK